MKLSKTTWLVIAIGSFVVLGIALYMGYSQRVGEEEQLEGELLQAQLKLEQERARMESLSSRQTELEKQLSQTTSQCEAVKAILSQPVGSITISSILFDIAEAYGLEVTNMTSPGLTDGDFEGITCSVITLSATVEGNVPNLVNFITRINSHLATGVVKSITINIPEIPSEEKASANIELVVHTFSGD
ncbi:hypothetical protein ACFLYG_02475 [Chloroflexota bacterium]